MEFLSHIFSFPEQPKLTVSLRIMTVETPSWQQTLCMDKGRVQKEEEKLLEFFINPIAHGPFIHCVPWEGGAESAPPPPN